MNTLDTDKTEWLWTERYRPQKVADCILPDRLKTIFQKYVDEKSIPNMILFGGPGVGKTTVALAMCQEIGLNHILINASNERGIDTFRNKVVNYASSLSLTGGRKVIILDEADNITIDAQKSLRGIIEEFSRNCTFILTCNFKSKILDALHSRSPVIDFNLSKTEKVQAATAFFKRLKNVLETEGVPYESETLAKLVQKFFPDYRRTLGELQRLSKFGAIDSKLLDQVSDIKNIKELCKFLKEKNFKEVRKWVVDNGDIDSARIFRALYDSMYEYITASSIPMAVLIIAKYQYQAAFAADQEINLVACLTEMMVDMEFK